MTLNKPYFAIMSGLCGSSASVFGKLCWLPVFEGYFLVRITFFTCMLLCNGAVWTFFARALQQTDSLTATVISSVTNYIFSALTGFLLFDEVTSFLWWSGMFFIVIGLFLVAGGSQVEENKVD